MGVLDSESKSRLDSTETLLARLFDISKKELANKPLTKDDELWIEHFDQALSKACAGHSQNAMKTTLVADVHTDQNSQEVMEEGTGYIDLIVVANRLPDGAIGLAAGPVFTHYELQPRLTLGIRNPKDRPIKTLLARPTRGREADSRAAGGSSPIARDERPETGLLPTGTASGLVPRG